MSHSQESQSTRFRWPSWRGPLYWIIVVIGAAMTASAVSAPERVSAGLLLLLAGCWLVALFGAGWHHAVDVTPHGIRETWSFGPWTLRERRLSTTVTHVVFRHEAGSVRDFEVSRSTVHLSRSGLPDTIILRTANTRSARHLANIAARALGVPIHDWSTGALVVLAPASGHAWLNDPLPDLPRKPRHYRANAGLLTLPPEGVSTALPVSAALALVTALLAAWDYDILHAQWVPYVFLLPCGGAILDVLRLLALPRRIRATQRGLSFRFQWFRTWVAWEDVMDVVVVESDSWLGPPVAVHVITAANTAAIARGHNEEDLTWIAAWIRHQSRRFRPT